MSLGVQLATNTNEEFVKVDGAIAISIEEGVEGVGLSLGNLDTVLLETDKEFTLVDLSVSIDGVEASERATKSSDGLGTSGLELRAELVED